MSRLGATRRGVTLAELMVVIVILGVMAGVTSIAFVTRARVPEADARLARLAATRARAVRSGQPETVRFDANAGPPVVTAFPDGRVVAGATILIDQLSGRSSDADR